MVLWCKSCGALLGLREPLDDWATDKTGLCAKCMNAQLQAVPPSSAMSDTVEIQLEDGKPKSVDKLA